MNTLKEFTHDETGTVPFWPAIVFTFLLIFYGLIKLLYYVGVKYGTTTVLVVIAGLITIGLSLMLIKKHKNKELNTND